MSAPRPRQEIVAPAEAPPPAGAYSSAIVAGDFLFLAGQAPCAADGTIVRGTIEEQTQMALANLEAIAEAAEGSLRDAVKVTVYLSDIGDWRAFDAAYAKWFEEAPPARTVVACSLNGFDVEIDAIVALDP